MRAPSAYNLLIILQFIREREGKEDLPVYSNGSRWRRPGEADSIIICQSE